MLLKIHEFAEFSGISTRALHLYDRIGLFCPAKTDETNGYRYYDTEQMLELNTILSFKKVGLPLKDIKEIKLSNYSKEIIVNKLLDRKNENQKLVDIASLNNEIIDVLLADLKNYIPSNTNSEQEALRLSKLVCLENEKLEQYLSQILWL
ncbi:MerR family transcriptional regulator [Anaerocolumna sedimenticola]|uniref:MerR family transcriptional regulator n=1 Tax=Anaerocolumna sedimenticola TaxID=2696063 RepID=A0A6P1TIA6_9FIRM|nr:MerR family transcriptional regulator [Anaerocolumna sedimenticola]QHQ59822.1 MerR family transcriptional regulator [Anaerocolumna sedimenticola]